MLVCLFGEMFSPLRPREVVACGGLSGSQLMLEGGNCLWWSTCGVVHSHGQLLELQSSPLGDVMGATFP